MAEGPSCEPDKEAPKPEEAEEDVMEICRRNMEAAKQTLSAFDALDRKWQVSARERERERSY